MLIYLRNIHDGHTFHIRKELSRIGRKVNTPNCEIFEIKGDKSISKLHAEIILKEGNTVWLKDLGSKYKTFHNDEAVKPEVEIKLKHQDIIKFGMFNSEYCLEMHDYIITTTCVNGENKRKLRENLAKLGLKFSAELTSKCTHITTLSLNLTLKVLVALVEEKLIVHCDYWQKLVECLEVGSKLPDVEEYRNPPMEENLMSRSVHFKANASRRELFKGKLFLFFGEKLRKQFGPMIVKAGGLCISWEKEKPNIHTLLKSPDQLVIISEPIDEKTPLPLDDIKPYLEDNNRLVIVEEIAYSVVSVTCEKHCNPKYNITANVFSKTNPKVPSQARLLVSETSTQTTQTQDKTSTPEFVPETLQLEDLKFEPENSQNSVIIQAIIKPETIIKPEKRKNEDDSDIIVSKPKIIKIDDEFVNVTSNIPSSSNCSIFEPPATSTQSLVNLSKGQNKFQITKKRKADDDYTKSAKKRTEINPFDDLVEEKQASMTPAKSLVENPYSSRQTQKVPSPPKRQSKRTNQSKSNENRPPPPARVIEVANSVFDTLRTTAAITIDINGKWISKDSDDVKIEVGEEIADQDVRNFIELLTNAIQISTLDVSTHSSFNRNDRETRNTSAGGGTNFKTFRKNKPKYFHRKVIPTAVNEDDEDAAGY